MTKPLFLRRIPVRHGPKRWFVRVRVYRTRAEMLAAERELYPGNARRRFWARCVFNLGGPCVADLFFFRRGTAAGTIAHECCHAGIEICRRNGSLEDFRDLDANEEPLADEINHLVDEVTRLFHESGVWG